MKFIIITDTHLVPAGQRLYALDPAARLARAIAAIGRDHSEIAFVIVTGDLAHRGEHEAYAVLRRSLAPLRAPCILLMGNHDRRGPFRGVFRDADDDGNGFVQSIRRFDAATVITLDTLEENAGSHAGRLCSRRLAFLEAALESAPADKPVLMFQHHPPCSLGLPSMDPVKLVEAEEQWHLFQRVRCPDFLFFGHIHRPAAGIWRGIPFHSQYGINHQVAFDMSAGAAIAGTHEDPSYGLVEVAGQDITILQRSFLYEGPVFSLDDETAQFAASPASAPS